jgi:DNA-binding IclR family transcriptional regulator
VDNRNHQHKGGGGTVEAVEKALQILEAVGKARKIGVLELSRQIKLPYSTVHRLLGTLAHRELLAVIEEAVNQGFRRVKLKFRPG